MDSITEFAKLLKERDNPGIPSITVGIVISPPPNVRIRLNERIILTNKNLIFSAHILSGYVRNVDIQGETSYSATITNTDTLKEGDEVILMPSTDEQTYYVYDKAVRLL